MFEQMLYPEERPSLKKIVSDYKRYLHIRSEDQKGLLRSERQLQLLKAAEYWMRQWSGTAGSMLLHIYLVTSLKEKDHIKSAKIQSLVKALGSKAPYFNLRNVLGLPCQYDEITQEEEHRQVHEAFNKDHDWCCDQILECCEDELKRQIKLVRDVRALTKDYEVRERERDDEPYCMSALEVQIERMEQKQLAWVEGLQRRSIVERAIYRGRQQDRKSQDALCRAVDSDDTKQQGNHKTHRANMLGALKGSSPPKKERRVEWLFEASKERNS